MGPVKQYTGEPVDAPLEVRVYPGADGSFLLYEDDGRSFAYRTGEWMGMELAWHDTRRTLTAKLARGSKLLSARDLEVRVGDRTGRARFAGRTLEVKL